MRQIERASVVRIVSDLIKADGIIDIREIDFFDALKEKYGIIEEDEIFAESCTLSQSLSVIANFDEKDRHSLMNDFWKTTMSDDFCTKEEALLLLALRLNLTVKIPNEVTVLSVESSTLNFEKSQILYLESEYNSVTNNQMKLLYRELCTEVRLAGFELVYLPKLSEHYNSILEADLLRIAKFLYPKVSNERIYTICKLGFIHGLDQFRHVFEDVKGARADFLVIQAFRPETGHVFHRQLVEFLDGGHADRVQLHLLFPGSDGVQLQVVLVLDEFLRGGVGGHHLDAVLVDDDTPSGKCLHGDGCQ